MAGDDLKREKRLMRNYLDRLPPKWLFGLGAHHEVGIPAPMKVLFDAGGFMLPQWLYAAIRFDLPDLIGDSPGLTTEQLASRVGVDAEVLARLMTALMHHGYFDAKAGEVRAWRNSALSSALRREHPNSVRALVIHWLEDCYAPYGRFYDGLATGKTPFALYHDGRYASFFGDYLESSPSGEARFLAAMSATHPFFEAAVFADHDWSQYQRAIDVGGSNGSFLKGILERFPNLDGVLFDRPMVIEQAQRNHTLEPSGLGSRMSFTAGDFFVSDTLPAARPGDVYILRNILHDWSDAECIKILSSLAHAVGDSGASIVLVELSAGHNRDRHVLERARSTVDMLMYAMFDGQERTAKHMSGLLEQAQLRLVDSKGTRSIAHLFVAQKA